jgi:hypothetical protein
VAFEFTEDLGPFFNGTEFSEPATVAGVSVFGQFWDGYAEDRDIEGTNPVLACISADLPGDLEEGDTVVVSGKTYTIATIKPDGTGSTVLELEYQSG